MKFKQTLTYIATSLILFFGLSIISTPSAFAGFAKGITITNDTNGEVVIQFKSFGTYSKIQVDNSSITLKPGESTNYTFSILDVNKKMDVKEQTGEEYTIDVLPTSPDNFSLNEQRETADVVIQWH